MDNPRDVDGHHFHCHFHFHFHSTLGRGGTLTMVEMCMRSTGDVHPLRFHTLKRLRSTCLTEQAARGL